MDDVDPGWWIDSAFRGKGYGSALVDVLAAQLRARGVTRLGGIRMESAAPGEAAASTRMADKLRARWAELDAVR